MHGYVLKKYNEILNIVKEIIEKDFEVEVIHDTKYTLNKRNSTKTKLELVSMILNFHQK